MLTLDLSTVDIDIDWDALGHFLYLLDNGVGAGDAVEILELVGDDSTLRDVWNSITLNDKALYVRVVEKITGYTVKFCSDCEEPEWVDEITNTFDGDPVCESCLDYNYGVCEGCSDWFHEDVLTSVGDCRYCDRRCLGEYASWCEDCEEYYMDSWADEHRHGGCECAAPRPNFSFPANGRGTIENDERLSVELPAGTISEEGIYEIACYLAGSELEPYRASYEIHDLVNSLEPEWVKKDGNFTRRLSRAMYKGLGIKVPAAILSEIGNIARRNTADVSEYFVEFTRARLNDDAGAFYHDDSCWWGGHSESRCALKNWGGIGMRSYNSEDDDSYYPAGRIWVQPLDKNLKPTHATVKAHAFVVYNGYGNLEGYAPARIVAHLAGKTYRKVGLILGPQYINAGGFLIADEATCADTTEIRVHMDEHELADHHRLEMSA